MSIKDTRVRLQLKFNLKDRFIKIPHDRVRSFPKRGIMSEVFHFRGDSAVVIRRIKLCREVQDVSWNYRSEYRYRFFVSFRVALLNQLSLLNPLTPRETMCGFIKVRIVTFLRRHIGIRRFSKIQVAAINFLGQIAVVSPVRSLPSQRLQMSLGSTTS